MDISPRVIFDSTQLTIVGIRFSLLIIDCFNSFKDFKEKIKNNYSWKELSKSFEDFSCKLEI